MGTVIVLLLLLVISSVVLDFYSSTSIEDNTTINLNGVIFTVPKTNDSSINESDTSNNVNDTKKFGYDKEREIVSGNAQYYYDGFHNFTLYVCDSNRTAYAGILDGKQMMLMIIKEYISIKRMWVIKLCYYLLQKVKV